MRYGLIPLLLLAILIGSCDSEITGSVSSEAIPRQVESGCSTDQDLAHSDCPAIELTSLCDPFLCRVDPDQVLDAETSIASDYTLPECDQDCRAMDCSTIDCNEGNSYRQINVTINRDGQIGVSGILNEEIVFTCVSRTSCGQ